MNWRLLRKVTLDVLYLCRWGALWAILFIAWIAGAIFLTALGSPLVVVSTMIAYGVVTLIIVIYISEGGRFW